MADYTKPQNRHSGKQQGTQSHQKRSQQPAQKRNTVPPLNAFDNVKKRQPPNLPPKSDKAPAGHGGTGRVQPTHAASPAHAGRQQPDKKAPPKGKEPAGKGRKPAAPKRHSGRNTPAPPGQPALPGYTNGHYAHNAGRHPEQELPQGRQPAPKPPPRPKRRVSPARRRRRRFIAVFLTALALIVAGAWYSLVVFFKIEAFVVDGESIYTQQEIEAAFGNEIGENIFAFRAGKEAANMLEALPYLESVSVGRKLPGTVVFHVQPAQETYFIEWNGQYAVLSASLKVLRMADEAPQGLVGIYGLSDLTVVPGQALAVAISETDSYDPYLALAQPPSNSDEPEQDQAGEGAGSDTGEEGADSTGTPEDETVQPEETAAEPEQAAIGEDAAQEGDAEGSEAVTNEDGTPIEEAQPEEAEAETQIVLASPVERMAALLEVLEALNASGLQDITWINVTDTLSLQFRWEDRITVILGARSGLAEKLQMAVVMMTDSEQSDIGENERGTIDVSSYITTLKGYFTPE